MIYPEHTLIRNNSIYYLIKVANSTLHIFISLFSSKSMQVSLMSGDHIVDRNSEYHIDRMRKLDVCHAFHAVLT